MPFGQRGWKSTKSSSTTCLRCTNWIDMQELIKNHKDVDPFLLQKWERIFTLFFDRNASHNVDWSDFYLVVRRVRDIYGAESVQLSYAKKSMEALWQGLCKLADSDSDQLISLNEWVNLLKKVDIKQRTEPTWFNDYSNFMFKLFDVSDDGVLDVAEYTDGMSAYGYKTAECHEAFKIFSRVDKWTCLEKIPLETWKKLFFEAFFSIDKNAPGNHLFGKIDF
uniref:EF-hand domain-containing protein n=1 Tax=Acrobeloides nanus TaxID=290746 RepID=A0A914DDK4_9BILA